MQADSHRGITNSSAHTIALRNMLRDIIAASAKQDYTTALNLAAIFHVEAGKMYDALQLESARLARLMETFQR